jgi:hypothetical protein
MHLCLCFQPTILKCLTLREDYLRTNSTVGFLDPLVSSSGIESGLRLSHIKVFFIIFHTFVKKYYRLPSPITPRHSAYWAFYYNNTPITSVTLHSPLFLLGKIMEAKFPWVCSAVSLK